MTSKQWLMQTWKIDREIYSLIKARDNTLQRVLSITQSYSGNTVSGTKDPHKFDKLAELENTIDQRIDELVTIKNKVMKTIIQVNDSRYRQVLQDRYISSKSWEQIAVDEGYNIRHIWRLHGEALKAIEPFIPKT